MTRQARVEVTDAAVARRVGQYVYVGRAFAFVEPAAWEQGGTQRDRQAAGVAPGEPCVIPLVGDGCEVIPGVRLTPADLPPLRLSSITSDKALYREGRDPVHLLAVEAGAGGRTRTLEIRTAGTSYAQRTVMLDACGCGAVTLGDLPAGEFAVRWQDAPADEPSCEFTVAEYRLAPLVASLVQRSLSGQPPQLRLQLRVETFGVPVHGPVRLELLDRGTRVAETRTDARQGVVECTFALTGEGPHCVNVQMTGDPARTATVPLIGSRQSERSRTVFSRLGRVVVGALLPGEDSREVRGIYLDDEGLTTSPFQLERVDCTTARLRVMTEAKSLHVLTFDPSGATTEAPQPVDTIDRDAVATGETLTVPTPGPAAFVAVGALVAGRPWEGWAAVVHPSRLAPQVRVPPQAAPGEEVTVEIETGAGDHGSVYVVVKDARLPTADTPASRLAGQIKRAVEQASLGGDDQPGRLSRRLPPPPARPVYAAGSVEDLLTHVLRDALPGYGALRHLRAEAERPSLVYHLASSTAFYDAAAAPDHGQHLMALAAPAALADAGAAISDAAPPPERVPAPPSERTPAGPPVEDAEVLFAGLVPAVRGRAALTVRLGRAFTEYVVEAFVAAGRDWAAAAARFPATRALYAELQLPAFVHHGDGAVGQVHAGAASGRLRVRLTRDGQDVPLVRDGEPVSAGAVVEGRRVTLAFLALPGQYRVVVEDAESGAAVQDGGRVEVPGKLRRLARTIRFLEPGDKLAQDDDPGIRQLTVLPGLDRPFRALVTATADYGHLCCEQTAAKMLAAAALYALAGDDPPRREAAEAILLAGVRRETQMWLPGKGFKLYPESRAEPHAYYGPKAARYLHYLELLRDVCGGVTPELRAALDEARKMARDAAAAYRLDWPPAHPMTCEEAYATVRFGTDPAARARALVRARQQAGPAAAAGGREDYLHGAVAERCDAAYAAATLFRGGQGADFPRALVLANRVAADLGDDGRLYSTVDSVAAIALLSEMQAAHVLGAADQVLADGRTLSVRDAAAAGAVRTLQAVAGTVAVEVLRTVNEDWEAFAAEVPLEVSLVCRGKAQQRFAVGDGLELVVRLTQGYRDGDLLWVCLPDALARVVGGGQVKRFAADFRGQAELRIPLAATALTLDDRGRLGPQRFAVCVRNMFEEERVGNPGPLEVRVVPSSDAGPGLAEGAFRSLQALQRQPASGGR